MIIRQTDFIGVTLINPKIFSDDRGLFLETYQYSKYASIGISDIFVQDNQSWSKRGVLRGMHFQVKNPQAQLITVIKGVIFDVVVDLRQNSNTYGKWYGAKLGGEQFSQIYMAPGFAHGFYVLSERAEITYKVTDYYALEWDRSLLWNDPKIGVEWPLVDDAPVLSNKDINGKPFAEAELFD